MARPTGRLKAIRSIAKARKIRSLDPLQRPEIARQTARFLELKAQQFRDAVDTAIELGEILREVAPQIEGHARRWYEILGISASAAHNYSRLAALAEGRPDIIQKWKEIGASKLYRVARMSPRGREAVLVKSEKPRLIAINDLEFGALTAPYVPAPKRKVTADMRAHGFRMKVQAWSRKADAARLSGVADPALRAGLRKEILALCATLHEIAQALKG